METLLKGLPDRGCFSFVVLCVITLVGASAFAEDVVTQPLATFGFGQLKCATYSPDGHRVASAGAAGAFLWDADTAAHICDMRKGVDYVYSIAFSHSGNLVATGSSRVTLYSAATGAYLRTIKTPYSTAIASIAFSPDDTNLVLAQNAYVLLYNVATGELIWTFCCNVLINDVAVSADGTKLLTAAGDGTTAIRSIEDGSLIASFSSYYRDVRAVAISPDDSKILTIDGLKLDLWTSTGQLVREFAGHTGGIYSLAFSPDGSKAVSGSMDKTARVWDLDTGECLVLSGLPGTVHSVEFSPDGTKVLTGSSYTSLRTWDAFTGEVVQLFEGHEHSFRAVDISSDGSRVAAAAAQRIGIYDAVTCQFIKKFGTEGVSTLNLKWSPDGSRIITGGYENIARLWDVASGTCIRTFNGHTNDVPHVAYSPDGKTVLTGSLDTTAKLWDVETGECIRTFVPQTNNAKEVRSVAFSPDGATVIITNYRNLVSFWSAATGEPIRSLESECSGGAKSSPDGRLLMLCGGTYGGIKLVNAEDFAYIRSLAVSCLSYAGTAFSADGLYFFGGGSIAEGEMWDTSTGQCKRVFRDHCVNIIQLALTPDGKRLWTAAEDGTLKAWWAGPILSVKSDPSAGTLIAGDKGGITNYTVPCVQSEALSLVAPDSIDGRAFRRWVIAGEDKRLGETTANFTIEADTSAVALYRDPATIYAGPGETCTTIQAALDAALDYDVVIVRNGTYTGAGNRDLDFKGKAIYLRSQNGPSHCTISADASETDRHCCFYFHSAESSRAVVDGFTIRNGRGDSDSGGGIHIVNASPTITGNIINSNLGGILIEGGSPVISGNTITNNGRVGITVQSSFGSAMIVGNTISGHSGSTTGWHGAGIVDSAGSFIRQNRIFSNSTNGISATSGTKPSIITDNTISGHIDRDYGCGIEASRTGSIVSGNTISGNTVGIRTKFSFITISNNLIENSTSSGILVPSYVWGEDTLTIENNRILNNGGSGIQLHTSSGDEGAVIKNNVISGNYEPVYGGGGVFYIGGVSLQLSDNTITGNSCNPSSDYPYGSGIRLWNIRNCVLSGNVISGNTLSRQGAVCVGGTQYLTIKDNCISDNSGTGGIGGGLYIRDFRHGTISGNLISGNSVPNGDGGGMYVGGDDSTGLIADNLICNNSSAYGGGIAYSCDGAGFVNNIITGNTASRWGGGIYVSDSVSIYNSVIAGNSAGTGGGIYNSQGLLFLDRVTITENCANTGSAFSAEHLSTIRNCILWNNPASDGKPIYLGTSSDLTVEYCNGIESEDIERLPYYSTVTWGAGNIIADPLFADPGSHDYHLKSRAGRWDPTANAGQGGWATDALHSPCIDAGDPSSDFSNELEPNGGRVNMGAYGNTSKASKTVVQTLYVQSTPVAGIPITGDKPGSTDYTATCEDQQVIALSAPATAIVAGLRYNFISWTLDGQPAPAGTALTVTMDADHTAVAVYKLAPTIFIEGPTEPLSARGGQFTLTYYAQGFVSTANGVYGSDLRLGGVQFETTFTRHTANDGTNNFAVSWPVYSEAETFLGAEVTVNPALFPLIQGLPPTYWCPEPEQVGTQDKFFGFFGYAANRTINAKTWIMRVTFNYDVPAVGTYQVGVNLDGTAESYLLNALGDIPGVHAIGTSITISPFGDANRDCKVDIQDALFIRARIYQNAASGDNWKADLNQDGRINILDLIMVRNNLGRNCPE